MATLQARIEGYVGQLTSTATLPDALAAEASFLIRNYSAERLVEFANIAQSVGNEGFLIEEARVVKAYRNGELNEDDKALVVRIWDEVKALA